MILSHVPGGKVVSIITIDFFLNTLTNWKKKYLRSFSCCDSSFLKSKFIQTNITSEFLIFSIFIRKINFIAFNYFFEILF